MTPLSSSPLFGTPCESLISFGSVSSDGIEPPEKDISPCLPDFLFEEFLCGEQIFSLPVEQECPLPPIGRAFYDPIKKRIRLEITDTSTSAGAGGKEGCFTGEFYLEEDSETVWNKLSAAQSIGLFSYQLHTKNHYEDVFFNSLRLQSLILQVKIAGSDSKREFAFHSKQSLSTLRSVLEKLDHRIPMVVVRPNNSNPTGTPDNDIESPTNTIFLILKEGLHSLSEPETQIPDLIEGLPLFILQEIFENMYCFPNTYTSNVFLRAVVQRLKPDLMFISNLERIWGADALIQSDYDWDRYFVSLPKFSEPLLPSDAALDLSSEFFLPHTKPMCLAKEIIPLRSSISIKRYLTLYKAALKRAARIGYAQGIHKILGLLPQIKDDEDIKQELIFALKQGNTCAIKALLEKNVYVNSVLKVMYAFDFLTSENYDFATEKEKKSDFERGKKVLNLLISQGLKIHASYYESGWTTVTLCEKLIQNTRFAPVVLHLLDMGVSLTDALAVKMKIHLKSHPEFAPALLKSGKMTEEELLRLTAPPPPIGSKEDLSLRLCKNMREIELLKRKKTAYPAFNSKDILAIETARQLKKEVKKYLASHPEEKELLPAYNTFCICYDAFVLSHTILADLRAASAELRCEVKGSKVECGAAGLRPSLSSRVIRLFSQWHPLGSLQANRTSEILQREIRRDNYSTQWSMLRQSFLKTLAETHEDLHWRGRSLVAVHGTRMAYGHLAERAVMPMGMLLRASKEEGMVVPFSGELCGSSNFHNAQHISCSMPADTWGKIKNKSIFHDATTPLVSSVIYACQEYGYAGAETRFDYDASRARSELKAVESVFERNYKYLDQCVVSILRLRSWEEPASHEYLDPVRDYVESELRKENLSPAKNEIIKNILETNLSSKDLFALGFHLKNLYKCYKEGSLKDVISLSEAIVKDKKILANLMSICPQKDRKELEELLTNIETACTRKNIHELMSLLAASFKEGSLLQKLFTEVHLAERKRKLESVLEALTIKIKYPVVDESQRSLITSPIPTLFGITAAASESANAVLEMEFAWEEVFVEGKLTFGKEISCVFVEPRHLDRTRDLLAPVGLPSFPISTAYALETQKMMKGAKSASLISDLCAPAGAGSRGFASAEAAMQSQKVIAHFMQEDILPAYGALLSETPSYVDAAGVKHRIGTPHLGERFTSFAHYKESVEDTTSLARTIHGKMHSVRTAIAAQMLANFYSASFAKPVAGDRHLLALAAGAHDAQRQDEGIDYWDRDSGDALYSYLAARGYSKETCELYAHALREKDPEEKDTAGRPHYKSFEQRCIHDADVLEIMRVLPDISGFKRQYLAFASCLEDHAEKQKKMIPPSDASALYSVETKRKEIDDELSQLIEEWHQLIQLTESSKLKMHLEYSSGMNYYLEVLKIIGYLYHSGRMPIIGKYLAKELEQLASAPPSEILELLRVVS